MKIILILAFSAFFTFCMFKFFGPGGFWSDRQEPYAKKEQKETINRIKNYWDKNMSVFKDKGLNADLIQRWGEVDIAYPVSEEEYSALRGCAVVKVIAFSDDKTELPIERAHFESNRVELIPMRRLNVYVDGDLAIYDQVLQTDKIEDTQYYQNISFWAIPLAWFGENWKMGVDFKGERKDFIILRGTEKFPGSVNEWIDKENSQKLKVAEDCDDSVFGKFIQREFF